MMQFSRACGSLQSVLSILVRSKEDRVDMADSINFTLYEEAIVTHFFFVLEYSIAIRRYHFDFVLSTAKFLTQFNDKVIFLIEFINSCDGSWVASLLPTLY